MTRSVTEIVTDMFELFKQLNAKRFEYNNFAIAYELNQHREKEHHDLPLIHYDRGKSLERKLALTEEIGVLEKQLEADLIELRQAGNTDGS